jgi:hypothetical protein
MFPSSCIQSCLQSFLINVSSSSTQLLVRLRKRNHKKRKLSQLLVSQYKKLLKYNNAIVYNKVYIVIYLLLSVISISNCAANALVDSSSASDLDLDELGEIFKKVAYPTSTTTTKRSIIDNVYVPSITTVPTPSLTTFRYVLFIRACLFLVVRTAKVCCLVFLKFCQGATDDDCCLRSLFSALLCSAILNFNYTQAKVEEFNFL